MELWNLPYFPWGDSLKNGAVWGSFENRLAKPNIFFTPGLGCHRGDSLLYARGLSHAKNSNQNFTHTHTHTSQPTFAHTFLSTPSDVQPDKKKIRQAFQLT